MRKVKDWWVLDDDFFADSPKFEKLTKAFDHTLSFVTNFKRAIDVGGHYGRWAVPLSEKFEHVVSFEGRSDVFRCLHQNTHRHTNIQSFYVAIGDRFDSVSIGYSTPSRLRNVGVSTYIGDGDTKMYPLDFFDFQDVGLIKLDIEGYELFALRGAEETLKRCKPVVVFEENKRCLEHDVQYGETGAFLESLGATYQRRVRADLIYAWEQ